MRIVPSRLASLALLLTPALACSESPLSTRPAAPQLSVSGTTTAVLLAAGDIATCASGGDEATARLLDGLAGTILALGDNAYESGSASEFRDCYAPSWGRHRARTRPVPGNHEYRSTGAAPYYAYFGANAGPAGRGYYSFNVGGWHVVALNSNVGVGSSSAQVAWLKADLAAHPARCTLAYWHHPRFSSGEHGNHSSMQTLWQVLYDARVDVVLGGHDHDYERFARQTPAGAYDGTRGIRQFVVGTGGRAKYAFSTPKPNSMYRYNSSSGVLRLELTSTSYRWSFITTGNTVKDPGSTTCH